MPADVPPGAGHAHAHAHGDAGAGGSRRLLIAFSITATVFVAELVGAVVTGSLALLIDAAHMATDAGGLLVALLAAGLVARPPTARRTWGFARAEVLAATLQAAVLLGVGLFVLVEGVRRLLEPAEVAPAGLLAFGVVGLVGNAVSIAVLASGRQANLNLRAAFLEVVNDALGSVAVILAAVVIAVTGFQRADSIAAVLIGVLILPRAFRLLRETVDVLMEAVPAGLDLEQLRAHMLELPHVRAVHDLHATTVASGMPVLTAHVVLDAECFTHGDIPAILDRLQHCASEHFPVSIEHSTFQFEPAAHRDHEQAPHA